MESILSPSPHFHLVSLADGAYAAIATPGGAAVSNAGFVDLGEQTIIFDSFLTPRAAADLRVAAENFTHRTISYVINSHWHNDHIRGNQVFPPDTEILSTRITRGLIENKAFLEVQQDAEVAPGRIREMDDLAAAEGDPDKKAELANLGGYYRTLAESTQRLKLRPPTWVFEGRLVFHGSKQTAELIEVGPAHCENDMLLHLPEAKSVFASDLIFIESHPYLTEADPDNWLRALDLIERLAPETIVPGHGPLGRMEDLQRMRGYLMYLIELAGRLVDRNDPVEAVYQQSIPPAYARWKLGQFYHTNLLYLYNRCMQTLHHPARRQG